MFGGVGGRQVHPRQGDIVATGGQAEAVTADVTIKADMDRVAQRAVERSARSTSWSTTWITGQNSQQFSEQVMRWVEGTLPAAAQDADNVAYWALDPEELAAQIVAVINTPWGVNISDITIRSTGEDYVQ